MAKDPKPTKAEALVLERRNNQLEQLGQAIGLLTQDLGELLKKRQQLNLLKSVSLGLYDEIDKLAKKAPADQVTDLVLEQVNDFIRDSKVLIPEDVYVQRQKEFVAAGDNPEHRDAVIVMRQLRQGLERFEALLDSQQTRIKNLLAEARGVQIAVRFFIQGHEVVTLNNLRTNDVDLESKWMRTGQFSFDLLDRTDIPSNFKFQP